MEAAGKVQDLRWRLVPYHSTIENGSCFSARWVYQTCHAALDSSIEDGHSTRQKDEEKTFKKAPPSEKNKGGNQKRSDASKDKKTADKSPEDKRPEDKPPHGNSLDSKRENYGYSIEPKDKNLKMREEGKVGIAQDPEKRILKQLRELQKKQPGEEFEGKVRMKFDDRRSAKHWEAKVNNRIKKYDAQKGQKSLKLDKADYPKNPDKHYYPDGGKPSGTKLPKQDPVRLPTPPPP